MSSSLGAEMTIVIMFVGTKGICDCSHDVITLALGLRLMQGPVKVRAKSEVQKSHFMLSGV
jgi:hypothetical protein